MRSLRSTTIGILRKRFRAGSAKRDLQTLQCLADKSTGSAFMATGFEATHKVELVMSFLAGAADKPLLLRWTGRTVRACPVC
jgi:hypothetical protein